MALSPDAARVMIVGKDPVVTRTLAKLLGLDDEIEVLGEASTIGTAPLAELQPDVVVYDESSEPVSSPETRRYIADVAPNSKMCMLAQLRDLTVNDMLQVVRSFGPTSQTAGARHLRVIDAAARGALANLSDREIEVVRLVAEGLSNKEISSRLLLSDKTVKNHISHILAKMGLSARTQVAVYAIRAGLV